MRVMVTVDAGLLQDLLRRVEALEKRQEASDIARQLTPAVQASDREREERHKP